MREEYLVEEIVWDHQGGDVGHRARTDIEEEFVAVAELGEEAGRGLITPRRRQSRAAGDQSNLILVEILGARVVGVAVGCSARWRLHCATGSHENHGSEGEGHTGQECCDHAMPHRGLLE